MKRLFTLLVSVSLINAAIAAPVHQHPLPTNPATLALFQQIQDKVHANVKRNQLNLDALNKAVHARHVDLLKEWQAHNANSKLKGMMSDRIEQLLKQPLSSSQQTGVRMNILDLQTADALEMLISIQTAGVETMGILQMLYDDAVSAASGVLSPADRSALNVRLQRTIEILPYFQSITTFDGPKLLSAGNVRLQFGNALHADSTYLIKIPDFTREALGLTNLSLESTSQAQEAVSALYSARQTVQTVLLSVDKGYVVDAETMVFNLGFMLNDNFSILAAMRDLSVGAVSACIDETSCGWYEMELDYLKALMQKAQRYLSLNGVVSQGYGDLTIQIGNQVTPETTLTVHVPVTNAEMTGINDVHFQGVSDPFAAISKTNSVIREFTYGVQA